MYVVFVECIIISLYVGNVIDKLYFNREISTTTGYTS